MAGGTDFKGEGPRSEIRLLRQLACFLGTGRVGRRLHYTSKHFNDGDSVIPPSEITLLWRKHASGLGLLVRVRCSAKADDLVQEAFIRLARQPVVPDDPLSWLARTVRNLAIDTARRDARRQRREQLFCETRFAEASGTGRAPEFAARDVVDSLEHLTPEDRDIVVAHIWNSMTFRQIAEAFSLSSSTVNRRYLCALKQMKTALIKSFEEPQAEKTNHRMSGSGQDG